MIDFIGISLIIVCAIALALFTFILKKNITNALKYIMAGLLLACVSSLLYRTTVHSTDSIGREAVYILVLTYLFLLIFHPGKKKRHSRKKGKNLKNLHK